MKKIVILKWSSFIVLIIILLCGVYYYFFLNDWQRGFLERSLQYTSFNKSEYETKGLDFSHHNGRLDWGKLKDARKSHNINFMIFKATEGNTFKDSYYTKNIHNARKYGYICGAYHFFIPWIPSVLQAHNYISHAKLQKGDLPPIVDVEREAMVMSRHRIQETLLSLLKQLEKEFGTVPVIYCSAWIYEKYCSSKEFSKYPVWISQYKRKLYFTSNWIFWQYSENGEIDGVDYRVDMNVFNNKKFDSLKEILIN